MTTLAKELIKKIENVIDFSIFMIKTTTINNLISSSLCLKLVPMLKKLIISYF